jgi:hypothetical protein
MVGVRAVPYRVAATAVTIALAVILLVPAAVAAGGPATIIYNAREDFQASPNQENPSGPWSYRRTAFEGDRPLLENFSSSAEPCGPSGEGMESWFGPEVLDLPAVSKNTTGADAFPCGAFVPKGALMAHPGGDHAVVIRWTSPVAGSIRVRSNLVDRDSFCGDGIHWSLQVLGQPRIGRGNIPNGGSAKIRGRGRATRAEAGTRRLKQLRLDSGKPQDRAGTGQLSG